MIQGRDDGRGRGGRVITKGVGTTMRVEKISRGEKSPGYRRFAKRCTARALRRKAKCEPETLVQRTRDITRGYSM